MNTTHTPDPETWLDGLHGQKHSPETQMLRQLIQANPMPVPELDPQRREVFIKNLHQRGAFHAQNKGFRFMARMREFFAVTQGHGFALAASVAMLGIGLSLTWRMGVEEGSQATPSYTEPDIVMRGDEQAQRLVATNPRELANRIGDLLARYQLPLRRVENGPLVLIQAKVPEGHPARNELTHLGVQVPAHGRLNLLLVKG